MEEIVKALSEQRLATYGSHASEYSEAIESYQRNVILCSFLYFELHIFEIVFRNAIHCAATQILKNDKWILDLYHRDPKTIQHFKDHLNEKAISQLEKNINGARKSFKDAGKKQINEGDLIAAMTFGFWTTCISKQYHYIFIQKGILGKAFPNAPKKEFENISQDADGIRKLRNRVSHHEPIFNHKDLSIKRQNIKKLTEYASPATAKYFFPDSHKKIENFIMKISSQNKK